MSAISNPATINNRMLAGARATADRLDESAAKIKAMQADPSNDHPLNQLELARQAKIISDKKDVVDEEIADREALSAAYQSKDQAAIVKAQADLTATRAAHPKDFGKGKSVSFCQPCLNRKLKSIKPVRRPKDLVAMVDQITGAFEGRDLNYCAIADSAGDAGKLSFGKHQASETSGNLFKMLSQYSQNPNADGDIKAKIDQRLSQFSPNHMAYNGSVEDRKAFKSELAEACKDPAMQATQDEFFRTEFLQPAVKRAADRCVSSPLGKAMFYDMSIQTSPGGNNKLASDAMKRLGFPADGKCAPCDPEGPSEEEYLQSLNDTRRDFVANLGGDAANSTYREDFFGEMLRDHNLSFDNSFVVRGIPVKGWPPKALGAPPDIPALPKAIPFL